MKTSNRNIASGLVCAALTCTGAYFGSVALGQNGADRQGPPDGSQLIRGLMQTSGCLGVESGQMQSGKRSILAWFEDKDAVIRWYKSDVHQRAMSFFVDEGKGYGNSEPLAHVPDGTGPIMVIASLRPAVQNTVEDARGMNIDMISIELYQPLPGGAFVNDRLAPESFEVPHMKDFTR